MSDPNHVRPLEPQAVLKATQQWISSTVIDLNLCPFAARVFAGEKIRYTVSSATFEADLLQDLREELQFLSRTAPAVVETSLVIHPYVLSGFLEYNDFLDRAEDLLEQVGLRGILQIASFHPDYQFAGTLPDAVENYTNRSPYPMLHLLREESIDAVAGNPQELREIPRRNQAMLRRLGLQKVRALRDACMPDPS